MSDETGCDLPDDDDVTAGEAGPLERLLDRLLCDDATVDPAEVERGLGAAADGLDTVLDDAARVGATPREHSIGPYRLLGELGHGGQGVVYLARDERLGREVALKLIPDALTFSSASRLRFEREAEILAQLDHPGICTVYEVGEISGVPFIAMQRVRGESLAEKIRRTGELALDEATTSSCVLLAAAAPPAATTGDSPSAPSRTSQRAEILAICALIESAARALHTAHEAGLIHRDVKPGNIMVKDDGEPVILDFGLAKSEHSGPELTQTGAAVGTPAYMSPEQLSRHAVALDRRTDVYGLGVTLFECLTGVRPFRGPTREALYRAILDEAPADARRLNPTLSRDLLVVIATAMARNLDDRYGTMLELAEDLRRIREIEPITARPAGPTKRLTRWVQRNPVAAALTATAFLFLGVAASIFAWKSNEVAKKNTELIAAVRQRDESNDELRTRSEELAAALARFTRHRDVRRLEVLRQQARQLYRGKPEDAPVLRRWVREAEELLARLDVHRKNLAALEAAAGPYDEALKEEEYPKQWRELKTTRERMRELEAEIGAAAGDARAPLAKELELARERARWLEEQIEVRTSWGLDFEDEWRFDLLRDLVGRLEHFARSPGLIDFMRDRLRVAENIVKRTLDDHADAWRAAAARVADDPRYGGLDLRPQLGLIPLGPDPESGLEEFLHWESHDWSGGGGAVPVRDEEERFEIAPYVGIILVLVPPGTFAMGAQDEDPDGPGHEVGAMGNESPVREVSLDAYFISKFEMTRAQWARCVPNRRAPAGVTEGVGASHPVDSVSWEMAYHVVVPAGLTLPTEAQWERAARAGEHVVFPGEERIEDLLVIANIAGAECGEDGGLTPAHRDDFIVHAPVGSFEPNAFGLHDMAGNVSEWCWDFGESYASALMPGSGERASLPTRRAHRGGSFAHAAATARIAARSSAAKDHTARHLGLRPARPLARD